MIYIIPLLISLLIYILNENKNIINYGIISLLTHIFFLTKSFLNFEFFLILFLSFLLLFWLSLIHSRKIGNISHEGGILGTIFLIGCYLTIISTSIISLFISIEILTFTIIIIINLYIQDQYPGIIYYLLSGFITALFILALASFYLGSFFASKFLFIVFLFKLGLFPFHFLLPLIYLNLSPFYIFLIDIPYKIILFFLLIKFNFFSGSNLGFEYSQSLYIILLLLFSSIATLRYQNLLLIFFYSSLFNYSFILILINLHLYHLFFYYLFYYSLFLSFFLFLLHHYLLNKLFPSFWLLLLWSLLIFNLLGLPPFNGFFIKLSILFYLIKTHNLFLTLFSLLSILIISYTYFRLLFTLLQSYTLKSSSLSTSVLLQSSQSTDPLAIFIIFLSFPFFL